MGNSESSQIRNRVSQTIPQVDELKSAFKICNKTQKIFRDDRDRQQFIQAVITVLSDNGRLFLVGHEFRLLYSRRATGGLRATLVALNMGVIVAKVEPEQDGEDQFEAFAAFKKFVEIKLGEVLQTVPGAITNSPPKKSISSSDPPPTTPRISEPSVPRDAPPSYDSTAASSRSVVQTGKKS